MTQCKPGRKINFFSGRHLALKYFKVAVNSKKLVAIMIHTRKNNFYPVAVLDGLEDTRIGHIQHKRLTKPKMVSSDDRFTFKIVYLFICCILETGLTRTFAANLSLQIFNNH